MKTKTLEVVENLILCKVQCIFIEGNGQVLKLVKTYHTVTIVGLKMSHCWSLASKTMLLMCNYVQLLTGIFTLRIHFNLFHEIFIKS